jgi:hypothetical protein
MQWYEVELLKENGTADELNDMIGDGSYTLTGRTIARISPWTVEEIAALGREVTETTVRLIMPTHCMDDLRKATHIRFIAHRDYTGAMKLIPPYRDNGPRWVTATAKAVRT